MVLGTDSYVFYVFMISMIRMILWILWVRRFQTFSFQGLCGSIRFPIGAFINIMLSINVFESCEFYHFQDLHDPCDSFAFYHSHVCYTVYVCTCVCVYVCMCMCICVYAYIRVFLCCVLVFLSFLVSAVMPHSEHNPWPWPGTLCFSWSSSYRCQSLDRIL